MSEGTARAEPVLLIEDIGSVRRLTLNRPKSLNALNGELMDALMAALQAAARDDGVSVVILRGEGRAFCAGYDLNERNDYKNNTNASFCFKCSKP